MWGYRGPVKVERPIASAEQVGSPGTGEIRSGEPLGRPILALRLVSPLATRTEQLGEVRLSGLKRS